MNQPEELDMSPEDSMDSLPVLEKLELEHSLRQALRPVAPPVGFAERVLAQARVQPAAPDRAKVVVMPPRRRMWASGAVAAALLVGVFVTGDTRVRQQRERRKAELAQQQFEAGMRITGTTLDQVRQQLQQQGIAIGN